MIRNLTLDRRTRLLAATLGLCGLALYPLRQAAAQDVYITADRTIAGGNPINGTYGGRVIIGADAANTKFPGVRADVTGGTIASDIAALNASLVTISGGLIGQPGSGAQSFGSLEVYSGSTVNLTGGTLQGFAYVGSTADDGTTNTFNMSGGVVYNILNNYGGVTNVTGGQVLSSNGSSNPGFIGNYNNGTVNVSAGTYAAVSNVGYDDLALINFGGTANTANMGVYSGMANVTGGTVGKIAVQGTGGAYVTGGNVGGGGVTVQDYGVITFAGSGMNVTQTGTRAFFDENNFVNLVVSDYTVTGTLSDATALNAKISAGADFTNTGTRATFNAADLAPDLFVTTGQTVQGVYNNLAVGLDSDFKTGYDATATVRDGTDTVYLYTDSASKTTMTGGLVRGGAFVSGQSEFNLSGGEIDNGLYVDGDTTVHISGGTVDFVTQDGNSSVVVSGGNVGSFAFTTFEAAGSSLTFQGSGLSASGTTGHLWDATSGNNYLAAGNFTVTGKLTDGTDLNQTLIAGGASGNSSQQILIAPQLAPNLNVTTNTTVDGFYNKVNVGDYSTKASPTVTITTGADVGTVSTRYGSTITVQGGVVHGSILGYYADDKVTVTGGTIGTLDNNGYSRVEGGTISTLIVYGTADVNGGTVNDLRTNYFYKQGVANINGGVVQLAEIVSGTKLTVTGGTVNAIKDYRGAIVNILGGDIGEIDGLGGTVNIYGGHISPNALLNYGTTLSSFQIFTKELLLTGATPGTYTDGNNIQYSGVWWNVSALLASGDTLNTRYFERGGSVSGAVGIAIASPEPGSFLLVLVTGAVGMAVRKRKAA